MMKPLICLLVLVALVGPSWAVSTNPAEPPAPIVGSWVVTITAPGNEFPPLKGTYSFIRDGVLIATDIGQLSPPPSTAGQGAWKELGRRRFVIRWVNFALGAGGSLEGKAVLTGTLRVNADGDAFTGLAHFTAFDTEGNVVFAVDEVLTGTKIRP